MEALALLLLAAAGGLYWQASKKPPAKGQPSAPATVASATPSATIWYEPGNTVPTGGQVSSGGGLLSFLGDAISGLGDVVGKISTLTMPDAESVDYLARTVWGEARGEPEQGQVAVAHVILNRVAHRQWPDTVKGVVTQDGQFDVWAKSYPGYARMLSVDESDANFRMALRIAREALSGQSKDPTGGAYIYFNDATSTDRAFTEKVKRLASSRVDIGQHSFFLGVT